MYVTVIGKGFVGKAVEERLISHQLPHYCLDSKTFNVCEPETWASLPDDTEQVLLAVGEISNDINRLQEINVKPIKNLCTFLEEKKVKKIIMLSSGAVYGHYEEDTHPGLLCKPQTNYGKSKLEAEQLFMKYWKSHLNILRLYFPYGPHQKSPRLVPSLIEKIKNYMPIQINDDGGPFLSLTHIDDLSSIIVQDFIDKKNEQVLHNISSAYKVSIYDLSVELSKYINKKPVFEKVEKKSSNSTSIPYAFQWTKSGTFQDLFNET
ncbi:MAG: SDR family oxidoreductase [Alphaproteobacteria bacterium]|nr:SDR family oxidoreductase [Alphaproteobacteria bacterium]